MLLLDHAAALLAQCLPPPATQQHRTVQYIYSASMIVPPVLGPLVCVLMLPEESFSARAG